VIKYNESKRERATALEFLSPDLSSGERSTVKAFYTLVFYGKLSMVLLPASDEFVAMMPELNQILLYLEEGDQNVFLL